MDYKDLKNLKFRILEAKKLIGLKKKNYISIEINSRKYARRSLVLKNDITKNKKIKSLDIICKRPGTGISPFDIKKVIGKKVKKNLKEDHILKWDDLL